MARSRGADPAAMIVRDGLDLARYLLAADMEQRPEFSGRRLVLDDLWED